MDEKKYDDRTGSLALIEFAQSLEIEHAECTRQLEEALSALSEGGNAAMEAMCKVSCALRKAVDRLPEGDPAITGLSIARTLLDTEIEGLYATGAVPTPSTHAAKEAP
jgi:hypothetical protein